MNEAAPIFGAEPLIAVLFAMLADAALSFAPVARRALDFPKALFRNLAGWFDRRLNRVKRGRIALRVRGALVALAVIAVAVLAACGLTVLSRYLGSAVVVDATVLLFLLGMGRPIAGLFAVRRALSAGDDARAAGRAETLVRFDVPNRDRHAIARAAIEGASRHLVEGLFAALFWFLLLGLPALLVYRAIGASADAIGRASRRHADFGFSVSRLDDILSLPGVLIAGPVLALSALFCPGGTPIHGLGEWGRDLFRRGLSAGYRAEGGVTGALGLSLGGPRLYDGEKVAGSWIGDGRAQAGIPDLQRASILLSAASLLVALAAGFALAASVS